VTPPDDPRLDPRLAPLLAAGDDAAREAALQRLMEEHGSPMIAAMAARFRRSEPLSPEDADELTSLVSLRVVRRLHALAHGEGIASLEDYIATVAYHALYDLRREKHPERFRLKNRLRHLCTTDPRLTLSTIDGMLTCALSGAPGEKGAADDVVAVLEEKGAMPFDALVTLVAGRWDVREREGDAHEEPVAPEPDALASLQSREYMTALWREIADLPENQRVALLLNLRESGGRNALTLFLLLGVATADELAQALAMTVDELTALWEGLPFDDAQIASRGGWSRQQVISARQTARRRLARRMSTWKP
jgi:DNA-directed RNA polymerase specialized sigma24 family protein